MGIIIPLSVVIGDMKIGSKKRANISLRITDLGASHRNGFAEANDCTVGCDLAGNRWFNIIGID